MKRFTDHALGAKDVILLLEELHKRGYERLRFFGYVSPNGSAYRVHFAHREAMRDNGYELGEEAIWHASVGLKNCGLSSDTLADKFLREYGDNPKLVEAKEEDSEYVRWFLRVVELARRDIYLSPFSEYEVGSLYKGYIDTIGGEGEHLPLPPAFLRPFVGAPSAQVWVESAAQVARRLHLGQVDKAGVPYFDGHLSAVSAQGRDWRERVVGYLHDSTEDTSCTLETVLALLEEVAGASLPHRDRKEIELALRLLDYHSADSREAYIQHIVASPLAIAVKLHDLRHNMDISRLVSLSPLDYERVERYKCEFDYLSSFLRAPTYLD
ncbi:hypothetical protein [Bacteroides heparinolyticus]|uniref:hypothetical protein n=1 Tax=Prevotella heparinolytica TaxID=28113 RepID=UPI0035A11BEB